MFKKIVLWVLTFYSGMITVGGAVALFVPGSSEEPRIFIAIIDLLFACLTVYLFKKASRSTRKILKEKSQGTSIENENKSDLSECGNMGIGDLFKSKENNQLKARVEELEKMLTPEMADLDTVQKKLEEAITKEKEKKSELEELDHRKQEILLDIKKAKEQLIETNDAVLLQEFGLYDPKFDFANSDQYKSKLLEIRAEQKDMIKNKTAATGSTNWTVNNSLAKGRKMVADMQKLLIRAFNSECDEVIGKIKFNNIDAGIKRITNSRDAISKLGDMMGVSITPRYYKLKIDELHLAYEYQVKKQEEKEEQRQIREEMREQAKLQKEIEEARKKIEKDKQHYENALSQAKSRYDSEKDEVKKADLIEKINIFQDQLQKLEKELKEVDYREANQKAGYVYVISNIGSFGEGVYKIGMTRRLDPMDRVDELGDASVPFKYDVHAMIFSDDAPKLETALHHAFEGKKVNMINNRREFFRVSLDEIKEVVKKNFDKTVEFVDVPDAEQYRQSLLIQKTVSQQ